jgi:hypothetical protein
MFFGSFLPTPLRLGCAQDLGWRKGIYGGLLSPALIKKFWRGFKPGGSGTLALPHPTGAGLGMDNPVGSDYKRIMIKISEQTPSGAVGCLIRFNP